MKRGLYFFDNGDEIKIVGVASGNDHARVDFTRLNLCKLLIFNLY